MSTIAIKDGVMACDSIMGFDDELSYGIVKAGRTKNFLFGYVGRTSQMLPLYDWILGIEGKKGFNAPEDAYKFRYTLQTSGEDVGSAMLVDRLGSIWTVSTEGFTVAVPRRYHAVGNGAEYALGALDQGASSEVAITVAAKYDAFTGGEIHSFQFEERNDLILRPHTIRS